jgi:PAS domain S-box-containing protein
MSESNERPGHREHSSHSEELFRLFVETVEEYAIFAMDIEGRVVHWNAGAARVTGYEEAEILGRTLHELFTPEDLQDGMVQQELETATRMGRAADERWHVRKDGSRFWALGIVTPIYGPDRSIVGFGKILCDRTDLKQLQETLERRNQALNAADEQKNRFIAVLAHELRNPHAVMAYSASLIRRFAPENERLQRVAETIERQVSHSKRLVDDLTDIARVSRGKIQLNKQPLDLCEVGARAADAVRPAAEERQHTLHVSFASTALEINGDSVRVQQILVNLLTNAIRYTEPGGRISFTIAREGGEAVARVLDSGVGIAPDQLASIFELFSQAHLDYSETQAGLGIGLALTRELVRLHGGTIQARSEGVGKGSEFIVRIPTFDGKNRTLTG